jgi:protein phosphatase 1 regulatory subunit 7
LHTNSGDSDCDEEEEGEDAEEEDGDPLAELPDETEVHITSGVYLTDFSSICDKELDLVHSRLSSLERLRLTRFASHLQRLCLRQNFITNLDPEIFSHLTKLVDLDLYDNKIRHIGDELNNLSQLT